MQEKSDVIHGHVISQIIEDDGVFPNNSKYSLLVYKGSLLLHPNDEPESIIEKFRENNWTAAWKDGIYSYHHYHSNSHEVIGVYCGTADVQFGGEEGICVELTRGDVVVIPAGVAHKCLKATGDFLCIGAYPDGAAYDVNYGKAEERAEADRNIAAVPVPDRDPLFGADGPLRVHWATKA